MQEVDRGLDERRVIGVHEAVELLAAPSDDQVAGRVEGLEDPGNGPHVHAGKQAAFDSRHCLAGHRRPLSEIGLAPSSLPPKVANRTWEVAAQHRCMMASCPYQALTAGAPTGGRPIIIRS